MWYVVAVFGENTTWEDAVRAVNASDKVHPTVQLNTSHHGIYYVVCGPSTCPLSVTPRELSINYNVLEMHIGSPWTW
jgi:hypothetical protein